MLNYSTYHNTPANCLKPFMQCGAHYYYFRNNNYLLLYTHLYEIIVRILVHMKLTNLTNATNNKPLGI